MRIDVTRAGALHENKRPDAAPCVDVPRRIARAPQSSKPPKRQMALTGKAPLPVKGYGAKRGARRLCLQLSQRSLPSRLAP